MKSITTHLHLAQISHHLATFLDGVETVARATRFVQRQSPLTGLMFLQALILGFLKDPHASLNQLAQECARLGFSISPQGLHERINAHSQAFLQALYQQAFERFKSQQALPLAILHQFRQILLVDSTYTLLPEGMQDQYPGSGGKAAKASLKVQLVFDFLCGNLCQLTLQAGREADQAYRQYLELVQAGALVVMDLGYFGMAALHQIVQKGAFFLLRYHYPTALFDPQGTRIVLLPWLETQGPTLLERPVRLGASPKTQIGCRLISLPVPLAIAEERRRKAKRKAAKQCKTLSAAYLKSLGWSVFVTNVPSDLLSSQHVIAFYNIRWQIELIFKFWKSYCGLDYLPAVRPVRVMTEFYAKLLIAVLTLFFIAPIRLPDAAHPQREISLFQVHRILTEFAPDLIARQFAQGGTYPVLEKLYERITRYGFKQIRRTKPNALLMLNQLSPQLEAP